MRQSAYRQATARHRKTWHSTVLGIAGTCALVVLYLPTATIAQTSPQPAPASALAPQKQTYLPRYQFKDGESLRYKTTVNSGGSLQTSGASKPVSIEQDLVSMLNVKDVAPDGSEATFATQFLSMAEITNGTRNELSSDAIQQVQTYIPEVRVRNDGTIVSTVYSSANQHRGFLAPSVQGLQAASLPASPMPLGGAWRSVTDVAGQRFYARYVLSGVAADANGDQIMTIAVKLTGQSKLGGQLIPGLGRVYVAAQGTGQVHFDNTLGILRDSTVSTTAKVTVQPRQRGNRVSHSQLTTTIALQLTPDAAAAPQAPPAAPAPMSSTSAPSTPMQ